MVIIDVTGCSPSLGATTPQPDDRKEEKKSIGTTAAEHARQRRRTRTRGAPIRAQGCSVVAAAPTRLRGGVHGLYILHSNGKSSGGSKAWTPRIVQRAPRAMARRRGDTSKATRNSHKQYVHPAITERERGETPHPRRSSRLVRRTKADMVPTKAYGPPMGGPPPHQQGYYPPQQPPMQYHQQQPPPPQGRPHGGGGGGGGQKQRGCLAACLATLCCCCLCDGACEGCADW
ncbi:hypothetical protein VDGL01_01805 [Verticillium dahliae]